MGAIDYGALSHERTSMLQDKFQSRLLSRGTGNARPDGLRYTVLNAVIWKKYEHAVSSLDQYIDDRKDFPRMQERAGRYISHCKDLINAIKRKRDFQGLGSLPVPKQHEMFEAVLDHFDELTHYLKRVEAVNAEAQINDLRSTVYVLKSITYSVAAIFTVAFAMELIQNIYGAYDMVLSDVAKDFADWLFSLQL